MKTLEGDFNTGRKYSNNGQIITYTCEVSNPIQGKDDPVPYWEIYIKFKDKTRNISGTIQTEIIGEPTTDNIEAVLLAFYDAGDYTGY
jgi:hypothetical protein